MNKRRVGLIGLLGLILAGALFAQLDPGMFVFTIWQNGTPAGIIYVPDRPNGTTVYAEHWILYPNYVSPNPTNRVVTEVVPIGDLAFTSDLDFFRGTPWGRGYRYVRTLSYDTTILPGR